ncbi:MAG: molybdopterin converting factor subunit 1 [Pseudomonadales bacterium]
MTITIMFFASIREATGVASLALPYQAGMKVSGLIDLIAAELGKDCAGVLTQENIRVAVNQELTHEDLLLKDGDEVAYFPPVTGG